MLLFSFKTTLSLFEKALGCHSFNLPPLKYLLWFICLFRNLVNHRGQISKEFWSFGILLLLLIAQYLIRRSISLLWNIGNHPLQLTLLPHLSLYELSFFLCIRDGLFWFAGRIEHRIWLLWFRFIDLVWFLVRRDMRELCYLFHILFWILRLCQILIGNSVRRGFSRIQIIFLLRLLSESWQFLFFLLMLVFGLDRLIFFDQMFFHHSVIRACVSFLKILTHIDLKDGKLRLSCSFNLFAKRIILNLSLRIASFAHFHHWSPPSLPVNLFPFGWWQFFDSVHLFDFNTWLVITSKWRRVIRLWWSGVHSSNGLEGVAAFLLFLWLSKLRPLYFILRGLRFGLTLFHFTNWIVNCQSLFGRDRVTLSLHQSGMSRSLWVFGDCSALLDVWIGDLVDFLNHFKFGQRFRVLRLTEAHLLNLIIHVRESTSGFAISRVFLVWA